MMATLKAGLTVVAHAPAPSDFPGPGSVTRFEAAIETARALNAPLLHLACGPGLPVSGRERVAFLDALRRQGDRAGRHGITLSLAPRPGSPLHSWSEALCLCDEASHPYIGLAWEDLDEEYPGESSVAMADDPRSFSLLVLPVSPESSPLDRSPERWLPLIQSYALKPGAAQVGYFALLGGARQDSAAARARLESDLIFARSAGIAAEFVAGR
jgi:hypothetical protein